MKLRDALFAALRFELAGERPHETLFDGVDEAFLLSLYEFANRQEVAHLVGDALERLGLLSKFSEAVSELYLHRMSVCAYYAEQQHQVFEAICKAFDKAAIPYLPLKGLVIRKLYPEPWMRTAGDIDILVKKENLAKAGELLVGAGAHCVKEGSHDITYRFPTGVLLELHYRLLDDNKANGARKALNQVWNHTYAKENSSQYQLEDPWLYYYHLAHAAKHWQGGSCGVRPFLDLWLLNHKVEFDAKARRAVLEENNLWEFANAAEKISEVWLSGAPCDDWTMVFEETLLACGVSGNDAVRWSIGTAGKGRKLKYFFYRVFPPHREMRLSKPILGRHPWMLPLFWVTRWFRLLFCGGLRHNRNTRLEAKKLDGAGHTPEELRNYLGI